MALILLYSPHLKALRRRSKGMRNFLAASTWGTIICTSMQGFSLLCWWNAPPSHLRLLLQALLFLPLPPLSLLLHHPVGLRDGRSETLSITSGWLALGLWPQGLSSLPLKRNFLSSISSLNFPPSFPFPLHQNPICPAAHKPPTPFNMEQSPLHSCSWSFNTTLFRIRSVWRCTQPWCSWWRCEGEWGERGDVCKTNYGGIV